MQYFAVKCEYYNRSIHQPNSQLVMLLIHAHCICKITTGLQFRKCQLAKNVTTCPVTLSVYPFKMCPAICAFLFQPSWRAVHTRVFRAGMDVLLLRDQQCVERFRFDKRAILDLCHMLKGCRLDNSQGQFLSLCLCDYVCECV